MNTYPRSISLALLIQALLLLGLACPSPAQHTSTSAAAKAAAAKAAAAKKAAAARAAAARAKALAAWERKHPVKVVVGKTVNLSSYGGDSTGKQDNSKAFAAAMAAAGNKGTVRFGPGTFLCSTVIAVKSVTLAGAGTSNTTFKPTDDTQAAIELTGSASLSGFTISPKSVVNQTKAIAKASDVWVEGANGGSVNNMVLSASGSDGVYLHNASNFTVSNTQIVNSTNYGVDIIDCNKVTIDHVTVNYGLNAGHTLNIAAETTGSTGLTISSNTFNNWDGSPINVSGPLMNSSIINNVFSEVGLSIYAPLSAASTISNLTISGNQILNAFHCAIWIQSNPVSNSVNNITVSNNNISPKTIYAPGGSGFMGSINVWGAENVSISGNTSSYYPFGVGIFGCKNVAITNNNISNTDGSAVNVSLVGTATTNVQCTGTLSISKNTVTNCCTTNTGMVAILNVEGPLNPAKPPPLAISIKNNTYSGPMNDPNVQYFIDCLMPGATVSGNTTPTLLPNNIVP